LGPVPGVGGEGEIFTECVDLWRETYRTRDIYGKGFEQLNDSSFNECLNIFHIYRYIIVSMVFGMGDFINRFR